MDYLSTQLMAKVHDCEHKYGSICKTPQKELDQMHKIVNKMPNQEPTEDKHRINHNVAPIVVYDYRYLRAWHLMSHGHTAASAFRKVYHKNPHDYGISKKIMDKLHMFMRPRYYCSVPGKRFSANNENDLVNRLRMTRYSVPRTTEDFQYQMQCYKDGKKAPYQCICKRVLFMTPLILRTRMQGDIHARV